MTENDKFWMEVYIKRLYRDYFSDEYKHAVSYWIDKINELLEESKNEKR